MMDPTVMSQVRLFGDAYYHASTVTIDNTINASEVIFARQGVENVYMPNWSTTTGASTRLIVGDFSRYVIPRRIGMTVEPVGLLPNVSNNRPDGTKGLFAYARVGGDCADPQAFRYQANT